jgi:hypothetical protein
VKLSSNLASAASGFIKYVKEYSNPVLDEPRYKRLRACIAQVQNEVALLKLGKELSDGSGD